MDRQNYSSVEQSYIMNITCKSQPWDRTTTLWTQCKSQSRCASSFSSLYLLSLPITPTSLWTIKRHRLASSPILPKRQVQAKKYLIIK